MKTIWWLASYPKSGNTWTRLFLSIYRSENAGAIRINDSRGDGGAAREMFEEVAGVDSSDLTKEEIDFYRPRLYRELVRQRHGPHFLKVHDAFTRNVGGEALFPEDVTAGVVYVVRNPLDVTVSYAHHSGCSPEAMVEQLCDGAFSVSRTRDRLSSQLPQKLLSWSGHVCSWVDTSGLPLHVTRYEDLLADPAAAFTSILRFVGLPLDEERLRQAIDATRFDRLQAQEEAEGFLERPLVATRPFFGKGRAGGWRDELSPALARKIIDAHRETMRRFGYLDGNGEPVY